MADEIPSLGEQLGNKGTLPTVRWRGREYKVAHFTPKVAEPLEALIAQRATRAALELQAVDPGIVADTRRLLRRRQHVAGGQLWADEFAGQDGDCLILWACVRYSHPDFTVEDAKAMLEESEAEVAAAYELVLPSFFAHVSAATRIPVETMTAEYLRLKNAAEARSTPSPPTASSS
jgi:hypothetical protein